MCAHTHTIRIKNPTLPPSAICVRACFERARAPRSPRTCTFCFMGNSRSRMIFASASHTHGPTPRLRIALTTCLECVCVVYGILFICWPLPRRARSACAACARARALSEPLFYFCRIPYKKEVKGEPIVRRLRT